VEVGLSRTKRNARSGSGLVVFEENREVGLTFSSLRALFSMGSPWQSHPGMYLERDKVVSVSFSVEARTREEGLKGVSSSLGNR